MCTTHPKADFRNTFFLLNSELTLRKSFATVSFTHPRRSNLYSSYGVATISKLLKIIRLFCKRALYKIDYSAKETYNFKEPTNHSHPILIYILLILIFQKLPIGSSLYIHIHIYRCILLIQELTFATVCSTDASMCIVNGVASRPLRMQCVAVCCSVLQ